VPVTDLKVFNKRCTNQIFDLVVLFKNAVSLVTAASYNFVHFNIDVVMGSSAVPFFVTPLILEYPPRPVVDFKTSKLVKLLQE
tara:strand:+ start:26 stop:274 length:249 start_codon:yes stop_codon:yes gene_type:complete